ncbi:MAG TPA: hypothetical protein VHI10_15955 [Mycobacterium sp.]|nr:hypothetical protein [Mycobacterium sp.]
MPSFRRRASVIDADRVEPPQDPDSAADAAEVLALAEEAEAEAAEAEAMAAAARARARAIRLRQQVSAAETVEAVDDEDIDVGTATEPEETPEDEPAPARRRWLRRIKWKYIGVGLVLLVTCALVAASGYMVWQHREATQRQQQSAEYAAAGRQSVVTLMSLDFNHAQEDVQRIIDNSTGQFKTDFESQAEDFVKVAQESKVITEVTVNSTAVESMTDDSAVVLVAASSKVTNSAGAQQEPRAWRLSVDLQRDGDQIKMSKVEFVP